jgi:hypothetical protein
MVPETERDLNTSSRASLSSPSTSESSFATPQGRPVSLRCAFFNLSARLKISSSHLLSYRNRKSLCKTIDYITSNISTRGLGVGGYQEINAERRVEKSARKRSGTGGMIQITYLWTGSASGLMLFLLRLASSLCRTPPTRKSRSGT